MNQRFFLYFVLFSSLFFMWSWSRQRELALKLENEQKERARQEQIDVDAANAQKRLLEAANNANIQIPPEPALQYITLGSLSVDQKRPLLPTLTNRGGAIDRIELVERNANGGFKYRSLDNPSGYPGYLALHAEAQGLKIYNVPVASPAALASSTNPNLPDGLQIGDILVQVNGVNTKTLGDYHTAIKQFNEGSVVRFTVLRGDPNRKGSFPTFGNESSVEIANFAANPGINRNASPPTSEEAAQPLKSAVESLKTPEAAKTPQFESSTESKEPAKESAPEPSQPANDTATEAVANSDSAKPADQPATPEATKPAEQIAQLIPTQRLEFDIRLIEQPLAVVRNTNRYPDDQVNGNEQRGSLLTTLASIDGFHIEEGKRFINGLDEMLTRNWDVKRTPDGNGVDFELPLRPYLIAAGIDADLTLIKSYRLKPYVATEHLNNFDFEFSTTIRNNSDIPHKVSVRQEGLSGLTLEGWWYSVKQSTSFSAAGARDVIVGRQGGSHELYSRISIESHAKNNQIPDTTIIGKGDSDTSRNLRYFGIDNQYFVAALLPPRNSRNGLSALSGGAAMALAKLTGPDAIKPYKDIAMNVGFYLDGPEAEITKARPLISHYRIFAGPKEPDLLENYQLTDTMYYGWSIFGMVAKPLLLIMHIFYSIVGNYGIAIMMLTVLVRSCMFPLSWRANMMGQKMQELAPELKKINETYKDDFQKRGIETQKLYKKYKLNPMASCLPMFIQLPIFIGLYRAVSTDVALRQKALIPGWDWCSNLAGPDQFMLWPTWMPEYFAGKGTGWFGPYINLLPIVTCALFIIQQKVLMPKATDEQTLMTQRVMMFMTVFMGVMFFKVPAGLCIYFITSSTWSLIERFLVKKFMPKAKLVAVEEPEPSTVEMTKPKTDSRMRNVAGAEPPEKLSELWPWLKKLMKPQEGGNQGSNGGTSNSLRKSSPANSSTSSRPDNRNRKKKRS